MNIVDFVELVGALEMPTKRKKGIVRVEDAFQLETLS